MKSFSSNRSNLFIILILTLVGFAAWMLILIFWAGVLWLLGARPDFWAMTEALSTAVAAAAFLSAGFIAYRELKAQDISQYIDIADRLYDELNSADNIKARRWIFIHLTLPPEEGLPQLTDEGRAAIKSVLNSLDRVAFLTRDGWIPDELVMPWINPMVVKAWIRLEPYVDFESQRRNEPDYYQAVRKLASRCLIWRAENLPNAKITWVDDAL